MSRGTASTVLLIVGYLVSLGSLTRFNRMVRTRDMRTLAVLEAGTVAIVAGFTLKGRTLLALSNVFWLLGFPAWYAWRGSRRG